MALIWLQNALIPIGLTQDPSIWWVNVLNSSLSVEMFQHSLGEKMKHPSVGKVCCTVRIDLVWFSIKRHVWNTKCMIVQNYIFMALMFSHIIRPSMIRFNITKTVAEICKITTFDTPLSLTITHSAFQMCL